MASIEKRNGKFRVRWRTLEGDPRSRTCPDRKTADALKLDIERRLSLGKDWSPDEPARSAPELIDVADLYLDAQVHTLSERTRRVRTYQLDVWFGFLDEWRDGEPDASWLSRQMLMDYLSWLRSDTGRHGRPRSASTARRYVSVVEILWAWADDWQDEHGWSGLVPRAKKISNTVRTPPAQWRPAPTWQEMAWVVQASNGWLADLFAVLYYTGLRVQQALGLLRTDVDLQKATLHVRPDLGKTVQEQTGRMIPISPHLVRRLQALPLVEGGWLLPCGWESRLARIPMAVAAWERTKARRAAWEGRPHHAMRAGFISGLKRLGGDMDAIEFLVGHAPTETAVSYLDPDALPLRGAVNAIPSIEEAFDAKE